MCCACRQVAVTSGFLQVTQRLRHDAPRLLLEPEHVVRGEKLSVSLRVLLQGPALIKHSVLHHLQLQQLCFFFILF